MKALKTTALACIVVFYLIALELISYAIAQTYPTRCAVR